MKQTQLLKFEVGKETPIPFSRGINIMWDESGFILSIREPHLLPHEVKAFKKGAIKIDLVFENNIIFFVFSIPNFMDASDVAFTSRISPLSLEDIPVIEEGKGFAFNMVLIEHITDTIRGIRVIALDNDFSKKLRECMIKQFDYNFDEVEHEENVRHIQSTYTAEQLSKKSIASMKLKNH